MSAILIANVELEARSSPGLRTPVHCAPCAVRPARLSDVPALEALIAPFVATGDLLPRSRYDLCRHIKEYHVAVAPDGSLIGSGALKVCSRELAELAALAVHPNWQTRGVGRALCDALIAEARALGLVEVFALTRKPRFFARIGFAPAERHHFPLKVWADCARCSRRDACDEVAVTLKLEPACTQVMNRSQ